jgi:hypothetical protein
MLSIHQSSIINYIAYPIPLNLRDIYSSGIVKPIPIVFGFLNVDNRISQRHKIGLSIDLNRENTRGYHFNQITG